MINWQDREFECNVFLYLVIQYLSPDQIHFYLSPVTSGNKSS